MSKASKFKRLEQFRKLSRTYSDASILLHEAIARKAGLTGTDHKYLGLIIEKGEITAGEISKLTGLTTGAVTGLVDRLEKKNLVKRQNEESDRRKVIIVPDTENALKLLEPLFANLQRRTTKLMVSFSEDEIQIIERYFTSAIEVMNTVKKDLSEKEDE